MEHCNNYDKEVCKNCPDKNCDCRVWQTKHYVILWICIFIGLPILTYIFRLLHLLPNLLK